MMATSLPLFSLFFPPIFFHPSLSFPIIGFRNPGLVRVTIVCARSRRRRITRKQIFPRVLRFRRLLPPDQRGENALSVIYFRELSFLVLEKSADPDPAPSSGRVPYLPCMRTHNVHAYVRFSHIQATSEYGLIGVIPVGVEKSVPSLKRGGGRTSFCICFLRSVVDSGPLERGICTASL